MIDPIRERRSRLISAIEGIDSGLEQAAQRLRAAPPWFRAGRRLEEFPSRLRAEASALVEMNQRLVADRELVAELRRALAEIDLGRFDPLLCRRAALDWLNGVRTPAELVDQLMVDPLSKAGRAEVRMTRGMAQAILRSRADRRNQFDDLDVLGTVGVPAQIIQDLIYTGCHRPPPPLSARPEIGVLLPLRLETRFYPPAAGGWRLRLRVIPDTASVDQHDPVPTDQELDAVQALWLAAPNGLDTNEGRAAWRMLVDRIGGPRAAWLARNFPPNPAVGNQITRPATTRQDPRLSEISGLPPAIEIWLGRGGNAPARVAQLSPKKALLDMRFPDPTTPATATWWSSWTKSVAAGVGVEIDIGIASPSDIDVIYAVGVGTDDPAGLFRAHRDAGLLGILEPGTPTNTVDGAPAADLGEDPEGWLQRVLSGTVAGRGSELISVALTGRPDTLGPVPGDTTDPRTPGQAMVAALWPPVWGHALKDIWGLGSLVHDIGLWAGQRLIPEGPWPPIRIGSQPYGLLPITTLGGWQRAQNDPKFESTMRPTLIQLRDAWARAAAGAGTVVGADTERFLQLIGRTASSRNYGYRVFISLELLHLIYWSYDGGIPAADIESWWNSSSGQVLALPVQPQRKYATVGWPQDLGIPLVMPTTLPPGMTFTELIDRLAILSPQILVSQGGLNEVFKSKGIDSLLIRLLQRSLVLTAAEVARAAQGTTGSSLEPVVGDATQPTQLAHDAVAFTPAQLATNTPQARLFHAVRDAIHVIARTPVPQLERILRATLDTASHRIDPWIIAPAWRRFEDLATRNPVFRLGAYGWVDKPFTGTAGPTAGGLLHAPSEPQALTAAILRDKAVNDPQAGRWDINLESATIRRSAALAEQVRIGAHISEVLGREVERLVADPTAIEQLRTKFPMRTEHAGRRVCDGKAVLSAAVSTLSLSNAQLAALQPLRKAVDSYGDLLVVEATFDVVSGRAEVAGATMDAAAGLGPPPQLESLRTARRGRSVNTNVLVAIPAAAAPTPLTVRTSPSRIADPSFAAFLDATVGAANSTAWNWHVDDGVAGADVRLSDLGLEAIDALTVSLTELDRMVLAAQPTNSAIASATARDAYAQAQRLVNLLGSRPAVPEDFVWDGSSPDDAPVRAELLQRYIDLQQVAALLQQTLVTASQAGTTEAARADALSLALRWGVNPLFQEGDTLADRVLRARAAFAARSAAAPTSATLATEPARAIARAIAEFASAEGRLAVLSPVQIANLPSGLARHASNAATRLNDLDTMWLSTVATVRPILARFEAWQLEHAAASTNTFAAWTNRPVDPWQANVAPDAAGVVPATRLVAVYGAAGALDPDPLVANKAAAVGVLDGWGETIPGSAHETSAVFGFNAPGSRPPQAILIAVPPVETQPLVVNTIVEIVKEARELAHARAATPDDLSIFSAAIPLTLLPATGITGVDL